jgi:hypothetical protein
LGRVILEIYGDWILLEVFGEVGMVDNCKTIKLFIKYRYYVGFASIANQIILHNKNKSFFTKPFLYFAFIL